MSLERMFGRKAAPKTPAATEGSLESVSEAEEEIQKAKSFLELKQTLQTLGSIEGSEKSYTAEKLCHAIDLIRQGKEDASVITRTAGLRAKVLELYEQEQTLTVVPLSQNEALRQPTYAPGAPVRITRSSGKIETWYVGDELPTENEQGQKMFTVHDTYPPIENKSLVRQVAQDTLDSLNGIEEL